MTSDARARPREDEDDVQSDRTFDQQPAEETSIEDPSVEEPSAEVGVGA